MQIVVVFSEMAKFGELPRRLWLYMIEALQMADCLEREIEARLFYQLLLRHRISCESRATR